MAVALKPTVVLKSASKRVDSDELVMRAAETTTGLAMADPPKTAPRARIAPHMKALKLGLRIEIT